MKISNTALLLVLVGCALAGCGKSATPEAKLVQLTAHYTALHRHSRYAEAIPVAERALAIAQAAFGPDHERVAQVLNDLGRFYELQQSQIGLAEESYARALAIRERLRSKPAAIAQSMSNLARVYLAQRRYAEAESSYRQVLAIIEPEIPPDHPVLLPMLDAYAKALRGNGNAGEADAVEARIARIRSESK